MTEQNIIIAGSTSKKTSPMKVVVNSEMRIAGTNSNFSFYINMPRDNTFTKVVLARAAIPKTFYNIAAPHNKFTLHEDDGSTVANITITVPPSNYNRYSLAQLLGDTVSGGITTPGLLSQASTHGWKYTMTPNKKISVLLPDNGKYTFGVSNNGVHQPQFIFTDENTLYEKIGFDIGSTNPFSGNSLTSTNVTYIGGERTIFIHSDIVKNNDDIVLQEIFTNSTEPYSTIVFEQTDYYLNSSPFTNNDSNTFTFRLTDEHSSHEIDLNGNAWNFTLILF
jgi:hypothetical protein